MIFNANKNWEIDNPIMRMFFDSTTKVYRVVEVAINDKLLHVDVKLVDEVDDATKLKRFILADIDSALSIISLKEVKDHWISLQTPKNIDNPSEGYRICPIKEIYSAEDQFGQRAQIFVGQDDFRYISSPIADSEDELKNKKLIYVKKLN